MCLYVNWHTESLIVWFLVLFIPVFLFFTLVYVCEKILFKNFTEKKTKLPFHFTPTHLPICIEVTLLMIWCVFFQFIFSALTYSAHLFVPCSVLHNALYTISPQLMFNNS